eukprot:3157980-Heterocapsa_arctica.AAC.1
MGIALGTLAAKVTGADGRAEQDPHWVEQPPLRLRNPGGRNRHPRDRHHHRHPHRVRCCTRSATTSPTSRS